MSQLFSKIHHLATTVTVISLLVLTVFNASQAATHIRIYQKFVAERIEVATILSDQSSNTNARAFVLQLPVALKQAALRFTDDHYGLDREADREWASLFPRGNGWFHVNNTAYSVAMYHQMHCVVSIRKAIDILRSAPCADRDDVLATAVSHTYHCLDYLRQSLTCRADTALEPTRSFMDDNGEWRVEANGTGVLHRCRDWVQVRRFLEQSHDTFFNRTIVN
ncbi:hypothetical protein PLICRDRAFT_176970 [Plicaturopsis crispa FD-325 SS-3]|nr:hypothetical protein PLICRDRAFT_176970 [Plicaturopsis crispa FD-325 SS-3]